MAMKKEIVKHEAGVPVEIIQRKIYLIRGHKVMLDRDLAELYGVETRILIQAVKRNSRRFPSDFLIQLSQVECNSLRSQIVISKGGRGGLRYLPYAFTEQGVAMLSSVLNSNRAIEVNIQIMRVFTKLREIMISHKDLAHKIEDLEHKFQDHDKRILLIFDAINRLLKQKKEPLRNKGPMGFVVPVVKQIQEKSKRNKI